MDYNLYIRSQEWRAKHKNWLQRAGYRCALFPWVAIGKTHKGKYRRYAIHHLHYRRLGQERYWWDVLPLCPFAHNWIVHGILSGFRRAKQQRHFPNCAQKLIHVWLRFPGMLKYMLMIGLIVFSLIGVMHSIAENLR